MLIAVFVATSVAHFEFTQREFKISTSKTDQQNLG